MSDPFLGEIKMVGFNFAPRQWAMCNGQLLPLMQNQALFSLLGTMYGGDGRTTLGLPDMRSRVPVHMTTNYYQGKMSGAENVTLTLDQMPVHTHSFLGTSEIATKSNPGTNMDRTLGTEDNESFYAAPANVTPMNPNGISSAGGGSAHPNIQPCLAVNFVIALTGLYPSRS
jgi:microcystin-dependent protein